MLPATEPFPPPLAEDWSALKDAVRRFEHDWRQAPRPGIGDYLPAGGPLRSRVLIELVHIDLELRLKAGESARVEEYLARYPELIDDPAVALYGRAHGFSTAERVTLLRSIRRLLANGMIEDNG